MTPALVIDSEGDDTSLMQMNKFIQPSYADWCPH
jgi:hypothetical protein